MVRLNKLRTAQCPVCGNDMIFSDGKLVCSDPNCPSRNGSGKSRFEFLKEAHNE